jgi:glycine/D-amino acid oxidase-like deaminating enzyme
VVAAGPWARTRAATAGVELPIVPVRHQYFVTGPIAGVTPDLPVLRIPDLRLYARAELNGLIVGGFEAGPESVDPRALPRDYRRVAVEPDWERSGLRLPGGDVARAGGGGVSATFQGFPRSCPMALLGPVPACAGSSWRRLLRFGVSDRPGSA